MFQISIKTTKKEQHIKVVEILSLGLRERERERERDRERERERESKKFWLSGFVIVSSATVPSCEVSRINFDRSLPTTAKGVGVWAKSVEAQRCVKVRN